MRLLRYSVLLAVIGVAACAAALAQKIEYSGIGKRATAEEIHDRDLSIGPDGKELPPGQGNAKEGAVVFAQKCAVCHGPTGVESKLLFTRLAGGGGSLTTWEPDETPGSFWPYATSIWDFIRRAMPEYPIVPDSLPKDYMFTERPIPNVGGGETGIWPGPLGMHDKNLLKTGVNPNLTFDQIYALTAYILYRNNIIKEDDVMDRKTLPAVRMPNRDGFLPPADKRWVWRSRDPETRIEPHVSPKSRPLPQDSKPVNEIE